VAMTNHDSPEILCEEILTDARRDSEEILQRAQQEAEALLARAAAEADRARLERLDQARAEAAHGKELILATVSIEAARLSLARVETLLDAVREEAEGRLKSRDGFDYRESVVFLAADAVGRMAGETFVIRLPEEDRALLGDGLAEEIASRAGRSPVRVTVSYEPTVTGGGPIVEDAEGRQMWDNRFPARLERLWPELRRRIAVETSLVLAGIPGGEKL
jgi:vacuolar-type H+-ATPase subunit E/Vma4